MTAELRRLESVTHTPRRSRGTQFRCRGVPASSTVQGRDQRWASLSLQRRATQVSQINCGSSAFRWSPTQNESRPSRQQSGNSAPARWSATSASSRSRRGCRTEIFSDLLTLSGQELASCDGRYYRRVNHEPVPDTVVVEFTVTSASGIAPPTAGVQVVYYGRRI